MSGSAPLAALLVVVAAPAWGQTAATPLPTRLWAAQTTANQITLIWTGAPGATGYVLYMDAQQGAQRQTRVATLSATVRRYVYIVRSGGQNTQQFHLEATGPGGPSTRVSFNPVTMVAGPVPPVAPASLTATESSPGVVTVTWPAVPGATAYVLGRSVGTAGLQRLCDFCSTATTYVDSGVTTGVRHLYTVATLTPSGLSTRATSAPLIPGTVTAGGTGGTVGTGGTPGAGGTPTGTTPAPLQGRYQVTLMGFTVQAQSYDNPLQLDGKGDEVYLATHVMAFDTASAGLVLDNRVQTSRIHGDTSRFSYRVKAGNAGMTGGLRTGDTWPAAGPSPKGIATDFPMILWQGNLEQGRSAVVLVPTVWEWDNSVELFGNWLTARHALLGRLLQPDPMAAILTNGNPQPMQVGSGGLFIRTNMFGDPRDRPIGLRSAQPAKGAGFYAPLPLDPKGAAASSTTYLSKSGSVVSAILPASPFASFASSVLSFAFGGGSLSQSLGGAKANIPLASASNAAQVLASISGGMRSALQTKLRSQQATGMMQLLTVLSAASPSTVQGLDLYLFENLVVLTPQAIATAMGQTKGTVGAAGFIDVPYLDGGALQGKYVLHLKVEPLP